MPKTCEIKNGFINLERESIPKFDPRMYDRKPFDVSELPVVGRKIGLGLAMGTALTYRAVDRASAILSRMEGIYTWQPKNSGNLALKIVVGTLGFGAAATALTYYWSR